MTDQRLKLTNNDYWNSHVTIVAFSVIVFLTLLAGCNEASTEEPTVEETQLSPIEDAAPELPPTPTVTAAGAVDPAGIEVPQRQSPECLEFLRWQSGIDLIVFLDPDVEDGDVDRLTALVAAWDAVTSVSFSSKQDAFEEFVTMFDGTDRIDGVSVSDMPPSLRLTAEAGQEELLIASAHALRDDPAVFEIGLPTDSCEPPTCLPAAGTRWEGGIDLIVFLNPDVSDEDIDRIADLVFEWDAVTSVSFTSKQAAFTEFVAMFEGTDNLDGVTVSDMPPSLRLTAAPGQEELLFAPAEALRADPIIFEVVAPVDICDS